MTQIGNYIFPNDATAVRITREEVLSRIRMTVRIDSLLGPFPSTSDLETELESIEAELALLDAGETDLRLTPDRYHEARRKEYQRSIDAAALTFAVHVTLITEDPFERSLAVFESEVVITTSGDSVAVTPGGNVPAYPEIEIEATGILVNPTLSDGTRTLTWIGTLTPGDTLTLNSDLQTALLNNITSVLPDIQGEFPRLDPAGTTLTYTDDAASSHQAILRVRWRDWWD